MSRKSRARWARDIRPLFTVYLPVLPYVLFALFPLYFMLVTSLKSSAELYDVNAVPFWIARGLTADHYRLLSTDTPFWSWFANSLIVSELLLRQRLATVDRAPDLVRCPQFRSA